MAFLIAWMFKSTILRNNLLPFTVELSPYTLIGFPTPKLCW
ncbi:hypothetical protein [Mycobacterium lepromatosis]|nr:hypothetical protein [Mycobacterium lepromatosis]